MRGTYSARCLANMILLVGIQSEPPLEYVKRALTDLGSAFIELNQRADLVSSDQPILSDGWLHCDGRDIRVKDISAIYNRLADYISTPEYLLLAPSDHRARREFEARHTALVSLLNSFDGLVVNRPKSMGTNSSKPYQLQTLKALGFSIPNTIVSNDRAELISFIASHERCIVKSASGIRSIVRLIQLDEIEGFRDELIVPLQVQEYIQGIDLRVHVVGETCIGCVIGSRETDYRYPVHTPPRLHQLDELPSQIASLCIEATRQLDLAFSGIDLRLTPEGGCFCFEVNPSPAYPYFEDRARLSVTRSLAGMLKNGAHP